MADSRQYMALEWVIRDIKDTLSQAQRALNVYAGDLDDVIQLRFCLTYIHQVYGSLHMAGFHGAAMIASEMEALAQELLDNNVAYQTEAAEVLMRAIEQLPNYLDHALKEKRDQPSLVFSLLNDLRAVRGGRLISEATLFSPNLRYAREISGASHTIIKDNQQLMLMMSKLRKMYQYAAASVIHQKKVEENLSYLLKVSQRLELLLAGTLRFALWEIVSAFISVLKDSTILSNASVKQLLRQLDDELKVLESEGSVALEEGTSDELLKNFLYYLSSSEVTTPAIDNISQCYELEKTVALSNNTNNFDNVKPIESSAMRAVAEAILEEFVDVKAALAYCRSEKKLDISFDTVMSAFQRVADTLAVLSVTYLRKEMLDNIDRVRQLQFSHTFSIEALAPIEQSIIAVETELESSLIASQLATTGEAQQFDSAQELVLQEARNGLEDTKNAVVNYIASQWDISNLKPVSQLLLSVSNHLSSLALATPSQILIACANYVEHRLLNQVNKPEWEQLDSLADVIASIDYFLEVLFQTKEEDVAILEGAENGLLSLGIPVVRVQQIMGGQAEYNVESVSDTQEKAEEEDDIPEEIVEIFVEEAEEVQETIAEFFPRWVADVKNQEALIEVRRAFHTLKGSGRIVNAVDVGELSWSIENMLNRILDLTLKPRSLHIELIQRTMSLLPSMIEAYSQKKATPELDLCQQYIAWAHELAKGNAPESFIQVIEGNEWTGPDNIAMNETVIQSSIMKPDTALGEEVAPTVIVDDALLVDDINSDVEEHEIDLQLWVVFGTEAETHLAVVKEFITRMEAFRPFFEPPSDAMQRAIHTLKGSAYMAEITPIAKLMTPMELFTKDLRSYQVNIDEDILQLIKDSVSYTECALSQIAKRVFPSIDKLDLFIARAVELRERSVGHLITHEDEDTGPKIDPALLEILMNNGMDQLLEIDSLIKQWSDGGHYSVQWQEVASELIAVRHSADRANLGSMTQLSYALEQVYSQLIDANLQPTSDMYATMLSGHHCLLDIIDAIAAGQGLPTANVPLLQEIEQLVSQASLQAARAPNNLPR